MDKYVYEICPYKDAHQKDGSSTTSLGSWKGFEDDYASMVFSGGQHCWNGPTRSIKVQACCQASLPHSWRAQGVRSSACVFRSPSRFCAQLIKQVGVWHDANMAPCRCLCLVERLRC